MGIAYFVPIHSHYSFGVLGLLEVSVIDAIVHIKLCLLLWFKFFKTMALLLSVLCPVSRNCTRIKSDSIGKLSMMTICSQRYLSWENNDIPTGVGW